MPRPVCNRVAGITAGVHVWGYVCSSRSVPRLRGDKRRSFFPIFPSNLRPRSKQLLCRVAEAAIIARNLVIGTRVSSNPCSN